jgi:hypothetical protein
MWIPCKKPAWPPGWDTEQRHALPIVHHRLPLKRADEGLCVAMRAMASGLEQEGHLCVEWEKEGVPPPRANPVVYPAGTRS